MKSDFFYWRRRAQDCIAHGALTNSKRPECHVLGITPTHLARGLGVHVWDWQGKKYVDHICGLGTNLLGYAHERVNQAIEAQMRKGASLSLGTMIEVETAEKLKELFVFCDAFRFLKSGSEACSAACRIARAVTGKELILTEGYHGWHDDFVRLTPPALGVTGELGDPDCPPPVQWLKDGSGIPKHAAAVIVEPVITDNSRTRVEWLKALRQECTEQGVLLIFDEIITGFRFPKFSVAAQYNIIPDLICLGKGMANGMPLAAVGGKYKIMNGADYFVSSTYAGETLSLAAAKETMTLLQTKYSMDDLWVFGQDFIDKFNAIAPELVKLEGYPTRGAFRGPPEARALFFQETAKAGVLFGASWWFNWCHIENYKDTINLCRLVLGRIGRGEVKLEGDAPKLPYAEKVRQ